MQYACKCVVQLSTTRNGRNFYFWNLYNSLNCMYVPCFYDLSHTLLTSDKFADSWSIVCVYMGVYAHIILIFLKVQLNFVSYLNKSL